MGYHMRQMEVGIRMSSNRFTEALLAIKALAGKETIHDGSGTHYSWVGTEEFTGAQTLEEALRAWRWNPDQDGEGNIVGIWFEGQKLGDDGVLFEAIAPFVEPGSYIQMIGDDDSIWRWSFDGSHVREVTGRVVFDDAPVDPASS